jgi:hypothetical protein
MGQVAGDWQRPGPGQQTIAHVNVTQPGRRHRQPEGNQQPPHRVAGPPAS